MPRVFRQQYTRPIPPDAQRVKAKIKRRGKEVEVDAVRFKGDDGKWVIAPIVETGKHAGTSCRMRSPYWYGKVGGEAVRLSTNKAASEVMLADLVRKHARGEAGMVNPYEAHHQRPLAEHVSDWEASLAASGASAKHVRQTVRCLRRLLGGCGFTRVADLDAEKVQAFLADLRRERDAPPLPDGQESFTRRELAALLGLTAQGVTDLVRRHRLQAVGYGKARRYPRRTAESLLAMRRRGRSVKTVNLYLDAAKAFCSWMAQRKRMAENPLADIEGGNVQADRRHDRQTLSKEKLQAVVRAAFESERSFRGLSGRDRGMLYCTACSTGYRAEELSWLRPQNFELDAEVPSAFLRADQTKNGEAARQPLPPHVVAMLRDYLRGRPAGEPVWPGNWYSAAAAMLRIDLEAAGLPYVAEAPDGRPLHADFHALRHSYIALLDRTGATLREAMTLARHKDPKLTMRVYGRAQLHDLAGAVGGLPDLLGSIKELPALQATGTDGLAPYTPLTQTSDTGSNPLIGRETERPETGLPSPSHNSLYNQGFEAERGRLILPELAPRVGLEPTTNRLTAGCSTIELSGNAPCGTTFLS